MYFIICSTIWINSQFINFTMFIKNSTIKISVPIIIIAANFSLWRNYDFSNHALCAIFHTFICSGTLWHMYVYGFTWACAFEDSTIMCYILLINMASSKASNCQQIPGIQLILFLDGHVECNHNFHGYYSFSSSIFLKSTCYKVILSLKTQK